MEILNGIMNDFSDTLLHEVEKERNKRISLQDKLKGEVLRD